MCGRMLGVQTVANNRERPNERDSRIRVCRLLCVARTGQAGRGSVPIRDQSRVDSLVGDGRKVAFCFVYVPKSWILFQ